MEFEKAELSDHVLVRSAADSKDTEIPNIESEYRMGYDLTVELLQGRTAGYSDRSTE